MGAPVRFQKAVSRLKENAAVERREARRSASRTGSSLPLEGPARSQGRATGCGVPHQRLSALRSLTFVRELPLVSRGDGNARRSPRLARTGAAELWRLSAGCLKCESDAHARKRWRAFWRNEPKVFGATDADEDLCRDRMQVGIDRNQAVRHQFIAEQPGLFARGLRGVAAQQREQRLDLFR